MDKRKERIFKAADFIKEKLNGRIPSIGIVLGSGLGKMADRIINPTVIPYSTIPDFPISTAIGHKGNFVAGELGGKFVIAMQGRFHYYEGYPMDLVTLPVRVMKAIGIEFLLVSNAAGGANPDYNIGDLMIIKDHINMFPNPLIGPNMDEFGPRFPDMTCAYDLELIAEAELISQEMGIKLRKGVYFGSTGPTYETPAEMRFYRMIGADAVGMSTIPEVIVARQCGIRVFGMSVITNKSNYDNTPKNLNDGDDVVKAANAAADRMTALFTRLISEI